MERLHSAAMCRIFAFLGLLAATQGAHADPPGAPGYDQASGYHHDYYSNGGTSGATNPSPAPSPSPSPSPGPTTTSPSPSPSPSSGGDSDNDNNSYTSYVYTPTPSPAPPLPPPAPPIDPRDVPPPAFAISLVTGIANATMAAVKVSTDIANRAVNTAYAVVKPHYDAYQAGLNAEKMEISHIVGSMDGSKFDDQSLQRANDNGVYNSYKSQMIPPEQQIVPSGPMQRMTMGVSLPPEEKSVLSAVDKEFRAGNVMVYEPGEVTPEIAIKIMGQMDYMLMTPVQKIGLQYAAFAVGKVDFSKFGNFGLDASTGGVTMDGAFGSTRPGSMVVVSNDIFGRGGTFTIGNAATHELQHAGDNTIKNLAYTRMNDTTLSTAQRNVAAQAYEAGVFVRNAEIPSDLKLGDYLSSASEIRAFTSTDAGRAELASQISSLTGMSSADAQTVVDSLAYSPSLQDVDAKFSAFLSTLP